MPFSALDHVGFTVSDMDRSVEFYSSCSGTSPCSARSMGRHRLRRSGRRLPRRARSTARSSGCPAARCSSSCSTTIPTAGRVDMETYNVGNAHLCLVTDDIARRLRAAARARHVPQHGPIRVPWRAVQGRLPRATCATPTTSRSSCVQLRARRPCTGRRCHVSASTSRERQRCSRLDGQGRVHHRRARGQGRAIAAKFAGEGADVVVSRRLRAAARDAVPGSDRRASSTETRRGVESHGRAVHRRGARRARPRGAPGACRADGRRARPDRRRCAPNAGIGRLGVRCSRRPRSSGARCSTSTSPAPSGPSSAVAPHMVERRRGLHHPHVVGQRARGGHGPRPLRRGEARRDRADAQPRARARRRTGSASTRCCRASSTPTWATTRRTSSSCSAARTRRTRSTSSRPATGTCCATSRRCRRAWSRTR